MPYFFGDGFDLYQTGADLVPGHWDSSSYLVNNSFFAGRFPGSRAMYLFYQAHFDKVSGQNDMVHHINTAFILQQAMGSTSIAHYVTFYDGATAQCTVAFRGDGSIVLIAGNNAGAILATYPNAFTARDTWFAFEIEAVVHGTNGGMTVRKLGNPTNDFTISGLNTRATTNNYANKIIMGTAANYSCGIDDFLWRSGATSVQWYGDVRCYTRYPSADVQTQWSKSTTTTNVVIFGVIGIGNTYGNGNSYYIQFTSTWSGNIAAIGVHCGGGGGTGHIKMALFEDNNNTVGNAIATSNEITNPGASMVSTTFPSPPHLTNGKKYWVGITQDANIAYYVMNTSSQVPATISQVLSNVPYAQFPKSNPGGIPSNGSNMPGNVTLTYVPGTNSDAVGESQQDGMGSYVYSQAAGLVDLYTITAIENTPAQTAGLVTRGLFQKTDAGTRNVGVALKSGVAYNVVGNTPLNTVWGWVSRTDVVDPATGGAWTAAGVNNIQVGPASTA